MSGDGTKTDKEILGLLCIGHRGAMGHEPENTLSSIRKALELGAPCVEVDVYFVDGELIVFHDDRLERTTNGKGYLCDQSFEYLRTLDAGDGQLIPTLDEVCEEIDRRACINIELKGPGTAEPVAELVSRLQRQHWHPNSFLVSSFSREVLVEARRLIPGIQLGVLIRGVPGDDCEFAGELGAFSVHPSLESVDLEFVGDAHSRNLKVYVYTVNRPKDIKRMRELNVDGVFTNFPDRVVEQFPQRDKPARWS